MKIRVIFKLQDPNLLDDPDVREWLSKAAKIMAEEVNRCLTN